jgi:glyoxylase-like metal-dependent hydrolase (beta-lactamase superfamily II)
MRIWFALFLTAAMMSAQTPSNKGYILQEIRSGLFWISDGAYNSMFLVTNDGVIAIDALPTLGQKYLDAIREVTNKPIRYLIYSHEHTDHIGAASMFPGSAKIIAQEETAAILRRRNDPRRPLPAITFRDRYVVSLGGQQLELIYPRPNHQSGNIIIWAPLRRL